MNFCPNKPGLEAFLGELEVAVMEVLWRLPSTEYSSGVIQAGVALDYKDVSISAINTTLNRLVDKGLVNRRDEPFKQGTQVPRKCWFSTTSKREEFLVTQVTAISEALLSNPETKDYFIRWIAALVGEHREIDRPDWTVS